MTTMSKQEIQDAKDVVSALAANFESGSSSASSVVSGAHSCRSTEALLDEAARILNEDPSADLAKSWPQRGQ